MYILIHKEKLLFLPPPLIPLKLEKNILDLISALFNNFRIILELPSKTALTTTAPGTERHRLKASPFDSLLICTL